MPPFRFFAAPLVLGLLIVLGAAVLPSCGSDEKSGGDPIVVYCGRDEGLVGELFAAFEKESGHEVQVFYQGTSELSNQLLIEDELSPCDLFFSQDGGHLGALADRKHLAELPADLLAEVAPRFRAADSRWLATSARARVLVHDPARVSAADLPARLEDLPQLAAGLRFGWAPANGSFLAHISLLIARWGEDRTRDWLRAMKARRPAPRRFAKNSAQVVEVSEDELDVGWVNHYYAHKLATQRPGLRAANRAFPTAGDLGNLLIVSGIGVAAPEGPRREGALELARFLVSEKAQRHFASKLFEYPTRPGVASAAGVQPLEDLQLADVDPRDMIGIGRAQRLLDDLGIR
jgi:iron(III) transport system substrate-binding protein